MEKEEEPEDREQGCFHWMLRKGRTLNERWAKSRNNLRQRFHRKHPEEPSLQPQDLLNDTGTPDMHLVKVSVAKENPSFGPPALIYKRRQSANGQDIHEKDCRLLSNVREIQSDDGLSANRPANTEDTTDRRRAIQDMHDLAKLYVADIIHSAEETVKAETGCGDIIQSEKESESRDVGNGPDLRETGLGAEVCGSDSWTSSVLSQAADSIVTYALKRSIELNYDSDYDYDYDEAADSIVACALKRSVDPNYDSDYGYDYEDVHRCVGNEIRHHRI